MKIGNGVRSRAPRLVSHQTSGLVKCLKISIIIFVLFSGCTTTQKTDLVTLNGSTMGTVYTVKIVKKDFLNFNIQPDSLHKQIDSLLSEINQKMSTYLDDSEISQFNRYREKDWFPVSPELASVIESSLDISAQTGGAFDITIGPLVNLWGFGPENRPELIPSEEEIRARKLLVGFENLRVQSDPPKVSKKIGELYCDLSAIAKGYGVDQIAVLLDRLGCNNYMVDIGGEIKTGGRNPQGHYWKIGVAAPQEEFGVQKIIPLENKAVATSGDYRNYFEMDGIRYSHMIDPRTGRPITHQLASVTVIQNSCMIADAFATAIDILGPDEGLKFALSRELPVFFIVREGNSFIEKMTPEFKEILELNRIGNQND
jgi:thiamine biosynthesis lipoprotein